MADPILHIKDTYYFEVPKALWRSNRPEISDYPRFWIRNDSEYQDWEAANLFKELDEITTGTPSEAEVISAWHDWQHEGSNHKNYAKPIDVFLDQKNAELRKEWERWKKAPPGNEDGGFREFLRETDQEFAWFASEMDSDKFQKAWTRIKNQTGNNDAVDEYAFEHKWKPEKIEDYNSLLHGKIIIPQPFGELRNLYQMESGIGITKFMLIQCLVAGVLILLFTSLAKRVQSGDPPRGRFWNLLESLLLFVRDEIAKPTMGEKDAAKYTPLLWTIFLFILGMNLMGMIPWMGAPTGSFAVTLSLAAVTMFTGIYYGTKKFGVVGFWLNLIPGMDLPWWISPIIKPLMFGIELLGFGIKHGVLGVRLLANMVAGHLVLLAIMGMAFTLEGAMSDAWAITAVVSVLASTIFSVLELFVAFLQAFLFTFLSSLFIAAATHHH